ncbi:bifunctional diguanylate cyclase/phosphodiesterase [soil metagenome]
MSQNPFASAFSFRDQESEEDRAIPPPRNAQIAKAAPDHSLFRPLERVMDTNELERIRRAVAAVGEATYHWVVESDEMFWSGNAEDVLQCRRESIASGREFAAFLDADNFTSRYDTVMRSSATDNGDGVPYQIEVLFRPDGRAGKRSIWLEDNGRWFAGDDGRPAQAFGIIRRIDDRHRRDQHLSFLGNCDPLTGMMNRGRMTEALGEAITVAEREGSICAFVIAGINNMAVVNDAYGFEVADDVIVAVARRLRQVVRTGDAIARYSGSKFGIILNNCTEDDLQVATERFLSAARESVIETDRGPVWAMLSIGGITLPKHALDANSAMARAEEALTEAKRLPSDGFVSYAPSSKRVSERSLNARCATEIVACLKDNRFKLAYQPIVSATTGETIMHEALLRMADVDGEMITAAHLIPIAEKLGLVRLIDRTVAQLTTTTLLTYPQARVSFNVSGITATDPRWFGQLTKILESHQEVTNRLTVEITETVALNELQETARFTGTLRELGCTVAIDDFGAGYTSFRNLKALNVDILKLDGSFCQNLAANPDNSYFVRSLIDLAKQFDLKTIAEWVETPEDAQFLREWGVDYLQGHLFGRASLDLPWPSDGRAQNFAIADTPKSELYLSDEMVSLPAPALSEEPAREEPEIAAEPFSDDEGFSHLRDAIAALNAEFGPAKSTE